MPEDKKPSLGSTMDPDVRDMIVAFVAEHDLPLLWMDSGVAVMAYQVVVGRYPDYSKFKSGMEVWIAAHLKAKKKVAKWQSQTLLT